LVDRCATLINLGAVTENAAGSVTAPEICACLVASGVVGRVRTAHGGAPRYALTPAYLDLVQEMHSARPSQRAITPEREAVAHWPLNNKGAQKYVRKIKG
jgi:hypothetical protein